MEFEKDGVKYTTDNEIVASAFLNSGYTWLDEPKEEAEGTAETAETTDTEEVNE